MRKLIFLVAVIFTALSLTGCRDYERQQDRLDKESEGKGALMKAESTKKVKIEEAKANYESAKLNAMTRMTKAEADSKAKIIEAEADAKVRIMHAESQSKANLIEYNKINRWNGKLPTTSVGSGSQSIISIK